MELLDFLGEWAGRLCCDGGLCECVALVNQWADENAWTRPQGFTAATLSFPPPWAFVHPPDFQPGDVVIWSAELPGSAGAGHTGIYLGPLSDGAGGFNSFDQNWGGANAHVQHHDWQWVARGWRHPSPPPPPPQHSEDLSMEVMTSTVVIPAGQRADLLVGVNPAVDQAWVNVRGNDEARGQIDYVSRQDGSVVFSLPFSVSGGSGSELGAPPGWPVGSFVVVVESGTVSAAGKLAPR